VFGESDVSVHPGHGKISAKAREVFHDDATHIICFNLIEHFLESGSLKTGSRVPVVDKERRVGETILSGVLHQDIFLIYDAVGFSVAGIIL
jgi:hypothetical protein